MRRWVRGRSGAVVAAAVAVVVIAVAAALVYRHDWSGASTHTATNEAIGAGVDVTGAKVPAALRATVVREAAPVAEARSLGDIVRIEPGGALAAPMTIRFVLSETVPAETAVVVASRDKPGDEWQFEPAVVSGDGKYASVERTHLTDLWPFSWNVGDLFNKAKDEILKAVLSEVPMPATPKCDRAADFAKDGYQVQVSGEDAMLSCTGVETIDGREQRVVRIADNRNYPLSVQYPGLKRPATPTRDEIKVELQRIGTLLTKLAASNTTVVFPGETLPFTVELPQEGDSARLSSEYSGLAQSLHRMDIALGALVFIFTKMGGKGVKNAAKARWEQMDKLLDSTECMNAVYDLNVTGLIVKCFTLARLKGMFDWRGVLLSPLIVGGAIGNWLQSEITSLIDQFNGKSKQTVLIGRPDEGVKFYGTWRVHGSTVTINKGGTGTENWQTGPCNYGHMCTAYTKISWRLDGAGKIIVTYKSYEEKDETGASAFDTGTAGEIVGTSYTATFVSTGFLRRSHHNSEYQFGNKALCGKGATQANRNECNV